MNGFNFSLNDLTVNVNSNPQGRRSLTREETFVLAWLVFNTKNRSYRDLMRDCKLSSQQCVTAIEGLIQSDLLHVR